MIILYDGTSALSSAGTVKDFASLHGSGMNDDENVIPVEVEAEREGPTRSTIEARDFELVVDEPEEMGGSDEGPNPLEYLLAGQAGCLNVTASQVAKDMSIEIENLDITIAADFDIETFETEHPDGRTGLQNVEVDLEVESDADDETLQEWGERVEVRCPVSDNIKNETDIDLRVR